MSLENNNSNTVRTYTRSSKYLITINNPLDHDLNRQTIINILNSLGPSYYCISDEVGLEEKTPHTHIYIVFRNARSFNTIKSAFPTAHIDQCYGTHDECINYVFKEGEWLDKEKGTTNIKDSHYEFGTRPCNHQGSRTDLKVIQDMINEGYSAGAIIEEYPNLLFRIKEIERAIEYKKRSEKIGFRHIEVTYISGATGTGKTRYVMEKYQDDVFRATNYGRYPFDGYNYEGTMMMDEFRDDIPIKDMLKYLDGYRLQLPMRYENKEARYTKVYIVSNRRFEDQYKDEQVFEPETYEAFVRRINTWMIFESKYDDHKMVFESYKDYKDRKYITLSDYEAKQALKYSGKDIILPNKDIILPTGEKVTYNDGNDTPKSTGDPWE